MKVLCLKCNRELSFRNFFGDNGNPEMNSARYFRYDAEGDKRFIECPHCGAKNITALTTSKDGRPELQLIGVEE
jgi:hypothetical protein